jgi:hypothetical protein
MGQPAAVGFDARARECGRSPPLLRGARLTAAFGLSPLCVDGSTVYRLESMPHVVLWYDYSPTVDHVPIVGHRPLDGSRASHPPFAFAIAASKRSSCARRPSSRIAARTRTTAIVSDTPKDRVHGGQLKSRAAIFSTTRRCKSTAQSTTRRLVRQAPRAASLALSGAPTAVISGRKCAR